MSWRGPYKFTVHRQGSGTCKACPCVNASLAATTCSGCHSQYHSACFASYEDPSLCPGCSATIAGQPVHVEETGAGWGVQRGPVLVRSFEEIFGKEYCCLLGCPGYESGATLESFCACCGIKIHDLCNTKQVAPSLKDAMVDEHSLYDDSCGSCCDFQGTHLGIMKLQCANGYEPPRSPSALVDNVSVDGQAKCFAHHLVAFAGEGFVDWEVLEMMGMCARATLSLEDRRASFFWGCPMTDFNPHSFENKHAPLLSDSAVTVGEYRQFAEASVLIVPLCNDAHFAVLCIVDCRREPEGILVDSMGKHLLSKAKTLAPNLIDYQNYCVDVLVPHCSFYPEEKLMRTCQCLFGVPFNQTNAQKSA